MVNWFRCFLFHAKTAKTKYKGRKVVTSRDTERLYMKLFFIIVNFPEENKFL